MMCLLAASQRCRTVITVQYRAEICGVFPKYLHERKVLVDPARVRVGLWLDVLFRKRATEYVVWGVAKIATMVTIATIGQRCVAHASLYCAKSKARKEAQERKTK